MTLGAREGPPGASVVRMQDLDVACLDEDLVTKARGGPPGPPRLQDRNGLLDAGPGLVVPGPFEEEAGPLQQHVRDVQAGGTVAPAEEIQGLPVRAQRAGGCALVTELARPLEESARALGQMDVRLWFPSHPPRGSVSGRTVVVIPPPFGSAAGSRSLTLPVPFFFGAFVAFLSFIGLPLSGPKVKALGPQTQTGAARS